ncbi:MAG: hypothetical protein ACYTAN_09805 [Planctomycetota bacterium]|jgi:hypothetical protein
MARVFLTYNGPEITPDANPQTLYQFLAAANHPVSLKSVELMPLGASAATAPLLFDVATQTDATGMTADAGNLVKNLGSPAVTVQTSVLKQNGAEPAGPVTQYIFTLHQQGSRVWVPPNVDREIVIPAASRLGLRYLNATFVPCRMRVELEE